MHLNYNFSKNNKPVLLLIHGFLGSMEQWQQLEHLLDNRYSILKIDLPGHGTSPEINSPFTAPDFIESLNAILKSEHIDHIHIMGHSMGGYLGAAFAKANPKKVASLTMLNSIAGKDPQEKKLIRNRAIELIQKHKTAYINMAISNLFTKSELDTYKDVIDTMRIAAHSLSTQSIINSLLYMRDREGALDGLKDCNLKINYIYSLQDQIIAPNLTRTECDLLNIKGKTINCGHMSLLTNPVNILYYMHFNE